jgi:hypothetical protein
VPQRHAKRTTGEREKDAFAQQLTDDLVKLRAQCCPYSDLQHPARRSRQHQIGDIGAGDQEHKSDRTDQ